MSHNLLILFLFCLLVDSSKCVEVACSNDTYVNAVCECTERTRTVNCTNRGLNEWPVGIPVNTLFLYLRDNNLKKIDTNALLELQELISINLHNNLLTSLPRFPKTIVSVYAMNNMLTEVSTCFNDLPNLRHVNIDHNSISILKNTTVKGSNLVDHLFLLGNSLQSIPARAFQGKYFTEISLKENQIRFIDKDAFVAVDYVHRL
ncbi:podocan-like [Antedon mediterranea]|uniref:podocan-like n=1 Tax=Antedon mediterranea TaxID=105859 RepID=UPI003AF5A6EE